MPKRIHNPLASWFDASGFQKSVRAMARFGCAMTTKNEIPLRICIGCGDQISVERIQVTPRATRCVSCETRHERQQKNASREQAEKVKPKKKRPRKPLLAYDEDIAESADGGFEIVKKRPTKSDR